MLLNIFYVKLEKALKIELNTSTDHKIVPGDRHTQSQRKSINSFLTLEKKTEMVEINMNDQQHFSEDSARKKEIHRNTKFST